MHKSLIFVFSAIAGVAFAQLPSCANECIKLPAACPNPLPSCICKQSSWINSVACCVFATCTTQADRTEVINYANSICNPEGVTLPTSPSNCPANETVSSTMSGSSASGAAATSSISSALSSASSAASSASSSASSMASSVSSSASAASMSATSTSSSGSGSKMAVADGVGFIGALLGVAALM